MPYGRYADPLKLIPTPFFDDFLNNNPVFKVLISFRAQGSKFVNNVMIGSRGFEKLGRELLLTSSFSPFLRVVLAVDRTNHYNIVIL